LHEVLPNQIETYLIKTLSTPSAPRNGVLYTTTQCFSQHGWHGG